MSPEESGYQGLAVNRVIAMYGCAEGGFQNQAGKNAASWGNQGLAGSFEMGRY